MASIAILGSGFTTRFVYGVADDPIAASGATDALPIRAGTVVVTSAGVDAMTLGTPKAGIYGLVPTGPGEPMDDGKLLRVVDVGGHAHTVTTAANKINGSKHIATFNGTVGSFVELYAFNGIWYVLASNGVALT